ncbi:phage holin family protein [Noviherbaspirillum sp. UKPF54]|uniref:phage holin family protein n=1 Tax=Noviherbaspirillum sp. UKPF54 TaxID=2601898 RepID=UPI0011B187E0|nr:phage holin family protein [Noviherbaspirillum sp. UKPF54]QDZ30362.1 hypothetical protein FAY22_21815 [Noviherbaspirillum sp. UKPF54]
MMIAESVARLAATLLAIVQTRVELAATEVEEESLRYFSYLLMSMAAMFCAGVAILLGTLLIVVLYWESNRTGVLLTLTILFALAAMMMGLRVRSRYRGKPKLLTHTMTELTRDTEMLQPRA